MCKKKVLKIIFSIVILFLLFSFFGCKKKSNDVQNESYYSNLIVGFSQIGAESAWRTCNTKSIMDAAAKNGIQVIYANAEQKQENQIKAIRSFIVYQVDVIVFVPIVQTGWDNVLQEAKDAKIPVILVDRKIITKNPDLYTGYIGTDSVEEGRKAANFLLTKFANHEGNLNILEVKGTDGSSAAEGRYKGFREVINKNHKFTIIGSESGDFLRSKGKEIIQNYLVSSKNLCVNNKPIDIIFSHNDGMTLGILDALQTSQLQSGKDITIVSVDGEQAAIDALKEGRINCIVECKPDIGEEVMNLVKTIANRNTIPKLIHVEEEMFTEFQDLSNLAPRGY